MGRKFLSACLAASALIAIGMMPAAAIAETIAYKASLKASDEVPPNASNGTGQLDATYDTQAKKLNWTVTFANLTGPATAAHFHGPAEVGKNAGVVVPISGAASPLTGSATLTDAQAADLAAGKWYVNVHTATNKAGEIRGQVAAGK